MARIKICGLTNFADVSLCAELGADYAGFIFAESPRTVSPDAVSEIFKKIECLEGSARMRKAGVFVNENEGSVLDIACRLRLDTLQFHGDEPPSYCERFREWEVFKAFPVSGREDIRRMEEYSVDGYLFDTRAGGKFGGTGRTFDWSLLEQKCAEGKRVILSGGLNPDNVAEAVETVKPFAVDASSGVEKSPGVKDECLLRLFVKRARGL